MEDKALRLKCFELSREIHPTTCSFSEILFFAGILYQFLNGAAYDSLFKPVPAKEG